MNAPCERIIAIEEPFTLDRDGILRLSMAIAEYEPKLIVIDPLFSYTGKINLDRDSDIRSVTDELKRLAEKYECSIVGIRHIGKSKGFGDARNAGLNGVGWRASARSVLLIGKNPENEFQKALCHTKSNYAPKFGKSIGFEIKDGEFFWTGESSLTAEVMLSSLRTENGEEKSEKQDAVEFLREVLRDGEKLAKDIQIEARQVGISDATLRRAKSSLNVQSRKDSSQNGKWFWRIEDAQISGEQAQNSPEDAQINKVEHLQVNNSNKTSYDNSLTEDAQEYTFEHLRLKNEHLQTPKCSCSSVMELIENGKTWFCPMGCESRKAN
jgi:ferredoxin-thioredoxin reductase catalytic subunit